MADEPTKSNDADDEPDYKKWATGLSIAASVAAILVALNGLTGWNPLKDLLPGGSPETTAAPTPATTTDTTAETTGDTTTADTTTDDTTTDETTSETPDWEEQSPAFSVESSQWTGSCSQSAGCPMGAIFRNNGGYGNASAKLYVIRDGTTTYLAFCSVVLPAVSHGNQTAGYCTANSAQLQQYIYSYRGQSTVPVHIQVIVDN